MFCRTVIVAATLMVVGTTAAKAQMSGSLTRPLSFGIAGGIAVPAGTLSNVANTGSNVTGILGLKLPILPIGLRADASYSSFGYKSAAAGNGSAHVGNVTGNVVVSMPFLLLHPYVLGGLGYYGVSASYAKSANGMGYDLGTGLSLNIPITGISVFAEARYNHVNTGGVNTQFTPIEIGVMF